MPISPPAESVPTDGAPALNVGTALFLDIDGTLVRHSSTPNGISIDAPLLAMLRRLASGTCGAIALISGRTIADIDTLFAPHRFPVAGQHGAERRAANGTLHMHGFASRRLSGAAEALRKLVLEHPKLLLEEKGATLALHFRNDPQLEALVEVAMRRQLEFLGDEFELLAGKFVLEVKPGGKDKGTAIEDFMTEPPFAGCQPVFVGDDLTDEFGFQLVNQMGGHSVKVGKGPTHASWRLPDSEAVRYWLSRFAAGGRDPLPVDAT
jgi:trehalose 6-phosphate phosphatase